MTDPYKYTTIAFANREFLGPYSREAVLSLTQGLKGPVLDVGCGKGAVIRAIGQPAVGIDLNPSFVEASAQENPNAQFFAEDAKEALGKLTIQPNLIVCLGASQAIGTPEEALAYFSKLLQPGGYLLFGDGIWERTPSQEYLEFLGAKEEEMPSFDQFRDAGRAYGLDPLKSYVSSPQDWDSFELSYYESMITWCDEHPEDPDAKPFRERASKWWEMYQREGRGVLGFAIVLFKKADF
ncbi:MAG: class I SAM-dependent methyltransferase [Armatimonadetes bacterium]|nr:class I SAM-dependent methyltransferase [Armatimonadota bacterium]